MARTRTEATPADLENGATVAANADARRAVINNGYAERYEIEVEMKEAMERHIEPIKERLKTLKKRMKNDTDMTSTDLNLAYKIYARNQDAKRFMDDDDGAAVQGSLQEIFEALGAGGQVSFLSIPGVDPQAGAAVH